MADICKVIATFVGPRPVRTNKIRQRRGKRMQDLGTSNCVMGMLKDVWDLELSIDPGMPMDTFLICNGGYPDEYRAFFEEIDNAKTKAGTMHVVQRENIGLSYGAYAHTFKENRDKYKYWMFTEDDYIHFEPGYLTEYVKEFEIGNTGYIANMGIAKYHDDKHVHGGFGLTSRLILDRVVEKHDGLLPHAKIEPTFGRGRHSGKPVFNHAPFCNEGEVPLTNTIHRMGYEFKHIGNYSDTYYDWKNNIV